MIVPQNLEKTLHIPIPLEGWSISTTSKAKRKPGKSGPAASAFFDPEPPLRRLHQKNLSTSKTKIKTPCPTSRRVDSRAEGLHSRFLRSQPRRIGSGSSQRTRLRWEWLHHNIGTQREWAEQTVSSFEWTSGLDRIADGV